MMGTTKLNSWMEMVHILSDEENVIVQDLKDGEIFLIDYNWVGFILRFQLFKEGYEFYK